MTACVLDASVAAKWVLPPGDEPLHREAAALILQSATGKLHLVVPDLFWSEMTNLLAKAVARGRVTPADAADRVRWLRALPIASLATQPFMVDALEIAVAHQRTAYDAFYVALAVATGRPLVTADERLANALGARFPVRWLGSIAI